MEVVRWCGSAASAGRLAALLRKCGASSLLVSDRVISPDHRVDVLLLCGDVCMEHEPPHLLVLAGGDCAHRRPAIRSGRVKLALVEGSDTASLDALAGSGIPAVTVGFSESDSISYSSVSQESCCVVVNRPFETAGQVLLMEQEILLPFGSAGVEELFLTAAALYLSISPEELGRQSTMA